MIRPFLQLFVLAMLTSRAAYSQSTSNDGSVIKGEYSWFDNARCEIIALEQIPRVSDNDGKDAGASWLARGTKPESGNCIVIHCYVVQPGVDDEWFTCKIHLQLPEKVMSGDEFDINVVASNRKTFVDKDRHGISKLNDTEATMELKNAFGGKVLSDKEHGRSKGGWHAQATEAEKIGSIKIMSMTPRIVTIRLKLLEERIGGRIGVGVSYLPESIALIRETPDAR